MRRQKGLECLPFHFDLDLLERPSMGLVVQLRSGEGQAVSAYSPQESAPQDLRRQ